MRTISILPFGIFLLLTQSCECASIRGKAIKGRSSDQDPRELQSLPERKTPPFANKAAFKLKRPDFNLSNSPSITPTDTAIPSATPSTMPSSQPTVSPIPSISPSDKPSLGEAVVLTDAPTIPFSDVPTVDEATVEIVLTESPTEA